MYMVDTSFWERDEKSQASGTRSKFWLIDPETDSNNPTKHLFKIPTEGTGGHWAEFLASKVGAQLGFHTAEVKLAIYKGIIGTISKNFRAKTEELYEGGDLFLAQFEDFDRYSLRYYELPHIIGLLSAYDLEKDFVAIPVYDALIANNDRHCDNWGVLDGPNGIRLSPIYDNGSSLGFNVSMEKQKKMLTDDRMLAGFCNRGRSCIGLPDKKKPRHFDLLAYLYDHAQPELKFAVERLKRLDQEMLSSIMNEIPSDMMCDINKKWVIRLLLYRKNWILNWLEGSVKA